MTKTTSSMTKTTSSMTKTTSSMTKTRTAQIAGHHRQCQRQCQKPPNGQQVDQPCHLPRHHLLLFNQDLIEEEQLVLVMEEVVLVMEEVILVMEQLVLVMGEELLASKEATNTGFIAVRKF